MLISKWERVSLKWVWNGGAFRTHKLPKNCCLLFLVWNTYALQKRSHWSDSILLLQLCFTSFIPSFVYLTSKVSPNMTESSLHALHCLLCSSFLLVPWCLCSAHLPQDSTPFFHALLIPLPPLLISMSRQLGYLAQIQAKLDDLSFKYHIEVMSFMCL